MFDMDGVIIASETAKFEYLQKKLKDQHSIDINDESFNLCLGRTAREFLDLLNINASISEKVLLDFRDDYLNNITTYAPAINETVDFIKKHGERVDIIIVSGGYQKTNEKIISDFGLDKFIKKIFSRESVEKSKPFPDIYLNAMNHFNLSKRECVAIEDSINGLMSSNAAGVDSFAFVNDYDNKESFSSVLVKGYIQTLEDYEMHLL